MSRSDVYNGEMPKRVLTDHQIEILLTGQSPGEESLARLGNILTMLHGPPATPPSHEQVLAVATEAAEMSLGSRVEPEPGRKARGPISGLKRRLAGGLAAAVLLSGMTGVAVAADNSAPGDALYGLDRALEVIGIGNGGAAERIEEARKLLEEGELSSAIGQMADAVDAGATQEEFFSPEASRASQALRGAAENVSGNQVDPESEDVRRAVAAMLTEIAAMLEAEEFDGTGLGHRISEMARALGGPDEEGSQPGRPEDAGPPSPGEPDKAAPGRGSPDDSQGGPPAKAPGGPPEDTPGGPPSRP